MKIDTDKQNLLVLFRFDIESFAFDEQKRTSLLYPDKEKPFDQTEIIKRIVDMLDNHGARGSFAVAYDIIQRNPEMLRPVIDSPGNHEMTYHLHPRWDLQLERDFGKPLTSSFLSFYDSKTLDRLFSLAEEAFNKAYGYVPTISLLGNASISTPMVNLLEQRGYTVLSDYGPNVDYRQYEQKVFTDNFYHRRGFRQGPEAPLYPHAPNSIYTPNYFEGRCLGDMKTVIIPVSQIEVGEGLICDSLFADPGKLINAIQSAHNKHLELSTFMSITHTCFGAVTGPGKTDINEQFLQNMETVLCAVDKLTEASYANCTESLEAYRRVEFVTAPQMPRVLDCGNSILYYDGKQSISFNAIGQKGSMPHITIAQENGIAEWIIGNINISPLVPPKTVWEIMEKASILSAEIIKDYRQQQLYRKNFDYTYKQCEDQLEITCGQSPVDQVYRIRENSISLSLRLDDNDLLIHRINVSPAFKEPQLDSDGSIVMENPNESITLRIKTTATGYETEKNKYYTGLRLFFERPGNPIHTGIPIQISASAVFETELLVER